MLTAENLGNLLRRAAALEPEADAFLYRTETIRYADWDELADRMAARLEREGIAAGDVVALLLPSVPLYLVAYLAAARLGAITTGINSRYRRAEIGHILRHCGAKVLIAVRRWHDAEFDQMIESQRHELPALRSIIWLDERQVTSGTRALVFALSDRPQPRMQSHVQSDQPVAIVYTSGTTGVPKGACYSHSAVMALAEIETRRYRDGKIPFQRHLAAGLSFAHVGTMARIAIQIAHRGCSILHDAFDPLEVIRTIERQRLVHLGGIPTQIILMLDHPERPHHDLSSLRTVLLGGAPSSAALIRRIIDTLGVTVSVRYSSTEVGIATASLASDPPDRLISTVGKPTEGVELRIVDSANQPLARDQVGEVVIRSPATMSGYWRAPELTRQVIDAEGWVHTGDLGCLGEDGYLRLKGRRSEMYIRGGYNVFPEEVEQLLAQHPKVARVGVLGIPDATFGELGLAVVVPRDHEAAPTLEELRQFVGEHLASFKRPDRVEIVTELPLTPMFKVDKRALRDQWSASR